MFNSDSERAKLFPIQYKFVDYLFRIIFEYYGWLYAAVVAFLSLSDSLGFSASLAQILGLAMTVVLPALLSRSHFSTRSISVIIRDLRQKCPVDAYSNREENISKYKILSEMEDKDFFCRRDNQHSITLRWIMRGARRYLSFSHMRHPIKSAKEILRRGYGTIEMQLVRTLGIEFGSYPCRIRRKAFEVIYSNMIFNGFAQQFEKESGSRKHLKTWIAQCYINNVSVKFGDRELYPGRGGSTVEQLYGRSFEEISNEEFFVWCLGLPYYKDGVGERALKIHADAVKTLGLDEQLIREAIKKANERKKEAPEC